MVNEIYNADILGFVYIQGCVCVLYNERNGTHRRGHYMKMGLIARGMLHAVVKYNLLFCLKIIVQADEKRPLNTKRMLDLKESCLPLNLIWFCMNKFLWDCRPRIFKEVIPVYLIRDRRVRFFVKYLLR